MQSNSNIKFSKIKPSLYINNITSNITSIILTFSVWSILYKSYKLCMNNIY